MAHQQVTIFVIEVEAGALAVAPHLAVFTLALPGPASIAHHLETVLPDVPEVVAVDVALVHVAADGGTAADGTVATYRGHLHAATAVEEIIADALLVRAEKPFASVTDLYQSFTDYL